MNGIEATLKAPEPMESKAQPIITPGKPAPTRSAAGIDVANNTLAPEASILP